MGQWVLASTWAQLGTGMHANDSQWEDKSLLFLILHVCGGGVGECVVCIFNICVSSTHGGFMSILRYAMQSPFSNPSILFPVPGSWTHYQKTKHPFQLKLPQGNNNLSALIRFGSLHVYRNRIANLGVVMGIRQAWRMTHPYKAGSLLGPGMKMLAPT